MMTLALFSLLSAALYYLGSRALITRWLWSRYPPAFARFADCAACTGLWFGVILSTTIGRLREPIFMTSTPDLFGSSTVNQAYALSLEAFLVGLCMLVLTPLVAGLMQHALVVVGSAVEDDAIPDISSDKAIQEARLFEHKKED